MKTVQIIIWLLVGVFQVAVLGIKVLHEADRLENLPLSKYNLDSSSLSIGVDIVRNRVMLVSNEEGGIIPKSRPFSGTARKILQASCGDSQHEGGPVANCSYNQNEATITQNRTQLVEYSEGNSSSYTSAYMGSFANYLDDSAKQYKSIVGIDDRVLVKNTQEYPYRTIGRLFFRCGSQALACTATLVGPRAILTSAYCIYSSSLGSECRDYEFSPGQQGDFTPFGTVKATQLFYPAKYISTGSTEDDYGVLILERDTGLEAGWMGVGYSCTKQKFDLETAGYPNDKDLYAKSMYNAKCPYQDVIACPCEETEDKQTSFQSAMPISVKSTSTKNETEDQYYDPWMPITINVRNTSTRNELGEYDPWMPVSVKVGNSTQSDVPKKCPFEDQSITFKHTCDVFLGQGGSPLWENVQPQFPIIRGIHSAGFGTGFSDQRNTAVGVGQVLYQYIKDIIDNN